MQFDSKTHKVDINTLTRFEANVFVLFLEDEKDRHGKAIRDAMRKMCLRSSVYDQFLESAILRHKKHLVEIPEDIRIVKEKFKL